MPFNQTLARPQLEIDDQLIIGLQGHFVSLLAAPNFYFAPARGALNNDGTQFARR